jgi:glycosyltransferase involved in cell wall biosynthesis
MPLQFKNIIVIPALNEEASIVDVLEKTSRIIKKSDKIIVVDNDSSDGTVDLVKKHFPGVEIISEKKRGKGNALRKGFSKALEYDSNFVTMIDGDGEKDPDDIPYLLASAIKSKADLVVGRRKRMRSWRREILRRFENYWINFATGYKLGDSSCGFNVIRSEILNKLNLKAEKFEIEPEIILESRRNHLKILECNVNVPKISPTKVGKNHIVEINRFFDRWVLEWIKSYDCELALRKKIMLKIFCNIGLLIFS